MARSASVKSLGSSLGFFFTPISCLALNRLRVDIHRQKMTDAQELLAHVIVDPNDHDPEKRMESFNELIDFENIFAEPPDLQSCDIVWFCSNLTFQATKNRVYYSQRFWFCILAAVWGIAFAVTSYLETFCCRPITEMIRRRQTPQLISRILNIGVMYQICQKAMNANSQPHCAAMQHPQHIVIKL
uniref:Caveolin n=1 Tax=Magallana gigas TaxID=29159 RepID=K1PZZ4_MAGGI